ncbi:5-carboxymethyl-2-hydroxymuconate isomerase [Fusarium pseudoanthophilum]|uniref:5-carboxymethyl-2-hydroxymuconate isomerase n=1 Tax=Fusarium pseudoanthophilum TaxID=48495 RepID=A0A8H5KZ50_9HYPO|nr:5-carboxymethyl-2-hydroxymuconate isomerase [Fusarium pseudoanthophilum]
MLDWDDDLFMSNWDAKYVSTNVKPQARKYDRGLFLQLNSQLAWSHPELKSVSYAIIAAACCAVSRADVVGRFFDDVTFDSTTEASEKLFLSIREAITIVFPYIGMPTCIPACYGMIGVVERKGAAYASTRVLRKTTVDEEDVKRGTELKARIYSGVGNSGNSGSAEMPEVSSWNRSGLYGVAGVTDREPHLEKCSTLKNLFYHCYRYITALAILQSTMSWSRLIRFLNDEDQVCLGDAVVNPAQDLASLLEAGSLTAEKLAGNDIFDAKPTVKETGRTPPPHPSIFIKPSRSITGWNDDIHIPKIAQRDQLDYEGELAIVIGREGKDISAEDALSYVAGYTVANDVSARTWQRDPKFAGEVPQWCFSKGFDSFAPLGPVLVSPSVLGAADDLTLQTKVNGEVRQEANTSDLVFDVKRIIAFMSQGTTLEKGSVILTGTPGGVALGMKPPQWLKDGDVVQVSISGIGTIRNQMVFQ